ncbi:ATP-binding protein, partial [Haliangium sp.]|uniref:ATP-binding protein n=1 Tax=Haliangium sp. TaxID=2663208 RepID=UPI003D0B1CA4
MALVYRAERERDHRRVVLKLLERHLATPDAIARYQHEFEVLEGLRIPGVIEVLGLETVLGAPMLVLDDFNAQSVAKQRREEPLGLNQVLTLALRVTAILSEVHGHDIVHCDINPSNILINRDTGEVKLADFGWSVRAKDDEVDPAEDEEPRAEYEPGGTLAYMSPEQTGRVDRRIDYRTDFYSLGVTLYELCTGRLPFETGDPLALVHCHLAQEPVPPHEVVPDIPVMVSDIIMKLMSKMPEQRYQTAHGCMHDLGECKRQLDDNGTIQAFPLGREDRPERFQIPTRLYGRERESATMRATLARVTAGDRRLLLVTGHPGIGKSALIKELGAAAAGGRRSFLEGKYDQYRRNIPYSALVQGFSTLVRQLLTEPQDRLDEWRRALTQALGASAHVLIEVIPELAVLLGPQPSVPRSGPSETENRFNHAFRGFVNVLCREHPLIVFLDDLQWADAASLRLMKLMLTDPDGGRLLLVGAYRDREVDAAHPLTTLLDQLGDEGLDIDRVSLRPLTLDEVSELLADTLRRGAADCADLAALIMAKTGGNPFFVKQFLLTLHHEQVFEFDRSSSGWRWDLDAVRELPITDNVVDLMVVRMRKLSMGTQRTLQLAACVGNIFDTATLAIICEDSPAAIDDRFAPVIDMGMVRRRPTLGLGGGSARPGGAYAFSHDRVQQAAYALIPANDEAAVHLNIARLLERSLSGEEREVRVFELVEHFVQGAALVDGDDERLRAAGLCLVAGRRAEESMAHESARRFLGAGLAFMPEQSWRDHYELMRDLTMAAAEVEYVNADVATARRLTDELLDNARDLLDKAKVRELQMMFHIAQQEMPEALEIGLDTLSMLGVSLPREPEAVNARVEELREQLDLNQARLAELENHPELTDPRQTMILRILERSATPAFYAEPVLWPLLTHTEVTVCVRHGHSALAAASYIQHAATLCGVNPDLELASGLGALALRLLERFPDPSIEVRASNMFHAFVRPWNEPDRGAVEQLRALVQRGLQAGALEHAFYAAMWCPWFRFQTGDPLDEVHRDQRAYQTLAERHGMVLHRDLIAVTARITRELLGRPADHERAVLQQPVVFLFQWTAQAALHNIMGDRAAALDAAERSEEHASIGVGLPVGAEQQYAYCLAALGALTDLDGDPARTRALLAEVERKQASMLVWAERVPENFLHKWALVAAEHARARNQPPEAMARFEEAIDAARKYGYTREEAMACERAASFYAGLGRKQIGDMYLSDAHLAYRRWGAQAKVMALEQEHPWLAQRQSLVTSGFQSSSGSGRTRTLDLESVVRASQALSSQLVLDQLLATLMKIIIENAGAQRGYLLLTGEDGGPDSLTLEAEGDIGDERFRALPSLPLDHPEARFARTAVSYVSRTRTSLVLSDAADQEPYAHDP